MESMECSFCDEVNRVGANDGLSFASSEEHIALPTLGCFVVGYSLVVSRAHINSMAHLDQDAILRLSEFVERVRAAVVAACGPIVVAEHGSGEPTDPTAACCEHAHMHFIPVEDASLEVLKTYESRGGQGKRLTGFEELRTYAGRSYLSLSLSPGEWLVWDNAARFQRQFIRRATAGALGQPKMFDWRSYPFGENMRRTALLLRYAMDYEQESEMPSR
ncbi:MAG: hypothetical protein E7812_05685 [Phenylobacterium sp.]|nr:MAG: hypothetical protein E7812_05685 [Phenylobacterium sp.]